MSGGGLPTVIHVRDAPLVRETFSRREGPLEVLLRPMWHNSVFNSIRVICRKTVRKIGEPTVIGHR